MPTIEYTRNSFSKWENAINNTTTVHSRDGDKITYATDFIGTTYLLEIYGHDLVFDANNRLIDGTIDKIRYVEPAIRGVIFEIGAIDGDAVAFQAAFTEWEINDNPALMEQFLDDSGGLEDITNGKDDYYSTTNQSTPSKFDLWHNASGIFSHNNSTTEIVIAPHQFGEYTYNLLYFAQNVTEIDLKVAGPLSDTPISLHTFTGQSGLRPSNLTGLEFATLYSAVESGGREPWSTLGATTTRFADVRTGSQSSNPTAFTRIDDMLFVIADNGTGGTKMQSSDLLGGNIIGLGPNGSEPTAPVPFQGSVIWSATDHGTNVIGIYKSDGTAPAKMILDAGPYPGFGFPRDPLITNFVPGLTDNPLDAVGKLIYFGYDSANGWEPRVSTGATGNTQLLADLNSGPGDSYPAGIAVPGMALLYKSATEHLGFFAAKTDATGVELGVTDGTPAGTKVIEIAPDIVSSNPHWITPVGKVVLFFADDGVHGTQLWKSDGTQAGTTLVKIINPSGSASSPSQSSDEASVVANGKLFFVADDGGGNKLWVSDGTEAGTYPVLIDNPNFPQIEFDPLLDPVNLTVQNGAIVVEAKIFGTPGISAFVLTSAPDPNNPSHYAWKISSGNDDAYTPGGVALQPVTELAFHSPTTGDVETSVLGHGLLQGWADKTNPTGVDYNFVGHGELVPGLGGPELIFQNVSSGGISIWSEDGGWFSGSGDLKAAGPTPVDYKAKVVAFIDLNPYADIVAQDEVSGNVVTHLTTGVEGQEVTGEWQPLNHVPFHGAAFHYEVVGAGNFLGTSTDQLLVENTLNNETFCYDPTLPGAAAWIAIPGTATLEACATGDFNGDGDCDIAYQNLVNGETFCWDVGDQAWTRICGPNGPDLLCVGDADVDQDGRTECLFQSTATGECYAAVLNPGGDDFDHWVFCGSPGTNYDLVH